MDYVVNLAHEYHGQAFITVKVQNPLREEVILLTLTSDLSRLLEAFLFTNCMDQYLGLFEMVN
ncbi:hypothetical protein MYX64_09685 [Nitrospinae bacterium AH_259_B05_G02_I21]|nr:hypothetical protein [Nitrospinae bacterium AH_259_B05_G02_I21]